MNRGLQTNQLWGNWLRGTNLLGLLGVAARMALPDLVENSPMNRRARRTQGAEGVCYHLLDRRHNRETVFVDDYDRQHFLALLPRYKKRFGFRLYHYRLMSNDFHLAVDAAEPTNLARVMARLLRPCVHYFHEKLAPPKRAEAT
jgi:REP element-mobilizing transposase RayT